MAGELQMLLTEWSARRNLNPTSGEDAGKHYLVFDGQYEVALSQLGNRIFLESDICPVPKDRAQAEALLQRLIALHFTRVQNSPDVLSLSTDLRTLTVFRVLSADRVGPREFDQSLGDFVNALARLTGDVTPTVAMEPMAYPATAQVFIP